MNENENQKQLQPDSTPKPRDREGNIIATRTEFFSGPFPHPELLAQYERVLPGAAERIFKLTESQSQHRRELEKKVVNSGVINSRLGTLAGLVIALAVIFVGFKTVKLGQSLGGWSLIAGSLASLVYSFRSQKQQQQRDLAEKKEEVISRGSTK